ncbi:MAG TPA: GspMb/PilO family protein [Longimicrobiales bacterium]|nr:GspMb/PilO family protein [Longimicrobiales bacterium]
MIALAARDRRAVRIGLLVLTAALAIVFGIRPYLSALEDARDRLTAERSLLARERALVDAADAFGSGAAVVEAGMAIRAPRLFTGDPTLAAGALVRYVAQGAARSSVLLEATETRAAGEAGDGLTTVRVQIRAVGDVEGVLRFLREMEDGSRLVHVERLSLESRNSYRSDGDDVQLVALGATIAGYALAAPGAGE